MYHNNFIILISSIIFLLFYNFSFINIYILQFSVNSAAIIFFYFFFYKDKKKIIIRNLLNLIIFMCLLNPFIWLFDSFFLKKYFEILFSYLFAGFIIISIGKANNIN